MRLKTFLPLLGLDSSEVNGITKEQADEYQRILTLVQRACIQSMLQKDITSAKLRKIFVDEKCISIEIQRLSIRFSLNIYLFQFATCCGKANSQLAEINIGRNEEDGEIISLIKEVISSKLNALMIGFSSEELVKQVLGEMKKDKKILSFRKSFMVEDISGRDFYFSIRGWRNQIVEIPLQIKTSFDRQASHQNKHADVPSLVLREIYSREEIIEKITEIGVAYSSHLKKIIHL